MQRILIEPVSEQEHLPVRPPTGAFTFVAGVGKMRWHDRQATEAQFRSGLVKSFSAGTITFLKRERGMRARGERPNWRETIWSVEGSERN
jgi:hypothetical protein